MIASHYAEPLTVSLRIAAELRDRPAEDATTIAKLSAGDCFYMLDNSVGWAWGYAGEDRRVGYVPSEALSL